MFKRCWFPIFGANAFKTAIQNIEYVESDGPILMDVLWAVVDLAIVPWGDLINAVV